MTDDSETRGTPVKRRQLASYLTIFVAAPLVTFTVGRYVDAALSLPRYPPLPWNLFVGLSVFIFGLGVGIKSTRLLYLRGGGLPWGEAVEDAKTRRLVTSGIYAYTRNPMVLGYSLLPFGMGVLLQSPGMALSITPVVVALNVAIVKLREEPDLESRFGAEYREYRRNTPFLFPEPGALYRGFIRPGFEERRPQLVYVSLTLLSLLLLTQLAFSVAASRVRFDGQRVVTGAVFLLICAVGLVAAVAPGRLRGLSHGRVGHNPNSRGHHPRCAEFEGHVVKLWGRTLCAGCTGLAVGAALAILGGVAYFFGGVYVGDPEVVLWTGALLVSLGAVQHLIDMGNPLLHLFLNVVFVYGAFMVAASLGELGVSLVVDAYMLASVLFWVMARIRVSQEEHMRVCSRCGAPCLDSFNVF